MADEGGGGGGGEDGGGGGGGNGGDIKLPDLGPSKTPGGYWQNVPVIAPDPTEAGIIGVPDMII